MGKNLTYPCNCTYTDDFTGLTCQCSQRVNWQGAVCGDCARNNHQLG